VVAAAAAVLQELAAVQVTTKVPAVAAAAVRLM
jgi:hypothetical protein